ncbi:protein-L-isoaspartate O-methyltransferase family protein [Sphingomonas lenta]|uniref:Protein-L-isoaspartate O-methyltransferase n=1 Tax=Sphingomonas lenta TaxID=1141887 RepID=A0A2A2SH13_9SPHN|nr:rRNA adenine N-6-methyltransferase family protein [Sphingomonas lenta]PAX08503.1 protein-L-isoaspartate O-methyltransferase [Sphingomonas lenta]
MTTTLSSPRPQTFEGMRQAMVASQLRTNAVNDPRVVLAMGKVPRERFVPEDERAFAYLDRQLALGRGRYLNVPVSTGRLLTEAYLEPDDRVLLIGAATGYAAAVLAELVAHVVAVESDPALAAHARDALRAESQVEIVEAPLQEGWPAGAPYDVLMIDGAVEFVPDVLLEQVKPDGRVVTGLVDQNVIRLASGRRSRGGFGLVAFADMDCAVLPGFSRPRRFTF